jgi:hypothetical protein
MNIENDTRVAIHEDPVEVDVRGEMLMTQKLRWGAAAAVLGSWIWLTLEGASFVMLIVLGIVRQNGQAGVAGVLIVWR